MNQKADTNHPCSGDGRKQDIQSYDRVSVKGMKTYAAPVGIKDGIGKQVIQIYHHRHHHVKPGFVPFGTISYFGGYTWNNKMKEQMDRWPEHQNRANRP